MIFPINEIDPLTKPNKNTINPKIIYRGDDGEQFFFVLMSRQSEKFLNGQKVPIDSRKAEGWKKSVEPKRNGTGWIG